MVNLIDLQCKMVGEGSHCRVRPALYKVTETYTFKSPTVYPDYEIWQQNHNSRHCSPHMLARFDGNIIEVYPGKEWNGPSFFLALPTRNLLIASLFHDCGYLVSSLGGFGKTDREWKSRRKELDDDFRSLLRSLGTHWFWAGLYYHLVRIGGEINAKPKHKPTKCP